MDAKKRRAILNEYTDAARQIELAGAAIGVLEMMRSREATNAINSLNRGQQRHLKRLDAAAAKLGAPYGA